jgi:hypothetical protein
MSKKAEQAMPSAGDEHGDGLLVVGSVTLTEHGAFLPTGMQVQPDTLIECEVGSLYASEYVALEAVRTGRGGHHLVHLFSAPWLSPVGTARIESDAPSASMTAQAYH